MSKTDFVIHATETLIEEARKMFKKILYPTDFSDVSKKALAFIKQLKEEEKHLMLYWVC